MFLYLYVPMSPAWNVFAQGVLLKRLVTSTIWCSNALLSNVFVINIHSCFLRLYRPCSNLSGKRTCSLLCTLSESACL